MVKMQIAGIQISVPEGEVSLYKRAGYSVLVEETSAPVVEVEPAPVEETSAPVEKKSKK